jgi:16S rRNA (guanine527-N7)-methyltransferase
MKRVQSVAGRSSSTKRTAAPGRATHEPRASSEAPRKPIPLQLDDPALVDRLRTGVAELHLRFPDDVVRNLLQYLRLLVKWNSVYNLTSVREPEAMLVQHLLDSLAIVGPLQRAACPASLIDVGSGGGLPGLVLALAWPGASVQLVEPVGKKAAFLQQCAAELALGNVLVHARRVEALPSTVSPPDLIVCRAFASLADFVSGIDRLAAPTTIVAAMKGAIPHEEISALPPQWRVAETLPLRVPYLDAQRHLLLLERAGVGLQTT